MGKSDQKKTQNNITEKSNQDNANTNTGIADTQSRMAALTPQAASQKNDIWNGYSKLAGEGGISSDDINRLRNGNGAAGTGGGGGGNTNSVGLAPPQGQSAPSDRMGTTPGFESRFGVGATPSYLKAAPGTPDYVKTFGELSGKDAGFDPGRLGNINKATGELYDTSGNYGDVNTSISELQGARKNYGATEASVGGLQKFASTGGLDDTQKGNINRDSLLGLEKTGGYTDADIANERARGNAGVASTYSNLNDSLTRGKMASGQLGPGWSSAGFKLARQGAQDVAGQTQKTEADIHERVNANKLAAGAKLGDLGLGTADLQSRNTLTGYNDAGNLDISKNTSINDAMANAGKLGLTRQSQIDAAKEAAAGIDTGVQDLQNKTRLNAAAGLSGDTLGKMNVASSDELGRMGIASSNELGHASIGAGAGAAQAALDAMNNRFLISEKDANRNTGLGGMLDTYKASPTDLQFNQSLLRGYGQDAANNSQNLIQDRTQASYIPGIGSTIGAGLDVVGKAAGLASGVAGGFSGLMNPNKYKNGTGLFTNGAPTTIPGMPNNGGLVRPNW